MDKVIDFINVNREKYLDELKALLAIPSISALPEHAEDVKRCAAWCADEMRRIGLGNVRRLAGRPRRAHDPFLRALRRSAGRSARLVGDAAVSGDDPRRRNLRARIR
jgi:acetylornithine deacetylase/succinyl-diaminopimelate desuccinylase-like protein